MNHPERSKKQNRKWWLWLQNTAKVTSVAVYPCTAMHVGMYGDQESGFWWDVKRYRICLQDVDWQSSTSSTNWSYQNICHAQQPKNSQTMISTLEMCWQLDLQLIIPLPTCLSIESPFNAPIISWENPQLRCVKYFSDSRTGHMISSWIFSKNCCWRYGSIE